MVDDEILIEAELTDESKPDTDYCCVCGKEAVWCYMPGGECYCDDCVPRGCSCNVDNIQEFGEPKTDGPVMWWSEKECVEEPGSLERKEDSFFYECLDEHGRRNHCCEFMWIGSYE